MRFWSKSVPDIKFEPAKFAVWIHPDRMRSIQVHVWHCLCRCLSACLCPSSNKHSHAHSYTPPLLILPNMHMIMIQRQWVHNGDKMSENTVVFLAQVFFCSFFFFLGTYLNLNIFLRAGMASRLPTRFTYLAVSRLLSSSCTTITRSGSPSMPRQFSTGKHTQCPVHQAARYVSAIVFPWLCARGRALLGRPNLLDSLKCLHDRYRTRIYREYFTIVHFEDCTYHVNQCDNRC